MQDTINKLALKNEQVEYEHPSLIELYIDRSVIALGHSGPEIGGEGNDSSTTSEEGGDNETGFDD